MSDSARSMDVLKKILKQDSSAPKIPDTGTTDKLIEQYLQPAFVKKETKKSRGRPKVDDHLKARNFTLCLAPKYVTFLDGMKVHDKKVQGRGRKIRFIIDQFVELHKRQQTQLNVLKGSLSQVEKLLKGFSGQMKKGQKLELTLREKNEISEAVRQVETLLKVLGHTPKSLHRLLPREEWSIVSFCLDWAKNNEVRK